MKRMKVPAPAGPHRILRLPAVRSMTGLSRSTLDKAMARGEFPRALQLGEHAIGWLESEVQMWISERIHARVSP